MFNAFMFHINYLYGIKKYRFPIVNQQLLDNTKVVIPSVKKFCLSRHYIAICGVMIVIFFQTGYTQEKHKYDSLYQPMLGYYGVASFEYIKDAKGKIIKEGSFNFESKSNDSLSKVNLFKIKWNGNFKNDAKIGAWKYEKSTHILDFKDVESFEAKYDLHTIEDEIQGNFEDEKPTGIWSLQKSEYLNGELIDTITIANAELKKAKVNGPFTVKGIYNGERYLITGKAKDGLLVGDFILEYVSDVPIYEKRVYQKGFLLELLKINKTDYDTLIRVIYPVSKDLESFFQSEDAEFKSVNVPLSLVYNDGYPRYSSFILQQLEGNYLLEKYIDDLFQFESKFLETYGLPLGTNRLYYPLSSKEKKISKEWPENEFEFRKKIKEMEEMVASNLLYSNNDTLLMINKWIKHQRDLTEYIQPWNNILSSNEIEFYNREGYLYNYAQDLMGVDSIRFIDDVAVFSYQNEEISKNNFLYYITYNLQKRKVIADSLQLIYNTIVDELHLAENVAQLQKSIVQNKHLLDELFVESKNMSELEKKLIDSVDNSILNGYFIDLYSDFLQTKSKELQKEKGDSLIMILNLIETNYNDIRQIFANQKKIDSLYTEFVFDPYTYNDKFPSRIKKRFYELVAVQFFEEMLFEAMKTDDIFKHEKKVYYIKQIHKRLAYLVDKDTKKLERKLKRTSSIEETLTLLKIE